MREADGLAMSSRNVYLQSDERQAATVLYQALQAAQELWKKGQHDSNKLRQAMQTVIASEPLANPDYVSAANPLTLVEYEGEIPVEAGVLLSTAIRFGGTRLIDNLLLA